MRRLPRSVHLRASAQRDDSPADPRGSGLGPLGFFDPAHPRFAVAVRRRVEEPARGVVTSERVGQVAGNDDVAWLDVERDLDLDVIAGSDSRCGPVLRAERTMERSLIVATVVR